MKINELVGQFGIWTSQEEHSLLEKVVSPITLSSLTAREQVVAEQLIRKSLLKKIGLQNPVVVRNETL